MERVQTRPASGVLRSRPGRRSLGLVERGGGVRGFVGLFTLTPGSSPGQVLAPSHRGRGDGSPARGQPARPSAPSPSP